MDIIFDINSLILIFFGALTLLSAILVVFLRNIVYSAFSLIVTFFSLAVFFIDLQAEFVAGVQVLIYVGGILVLFLFALMLSQQLSQKKISLSKMKIVPALLLSIPLLGVLLFVIFQTGTFPMSTSQHTAKLIWPISCLCLTILLNDFSSSA